MRTWLAVAIVVASSSADQATGLSVPLTVTERLGIERVAEPVTSGVPLSRGAAGVFERFGLFDRMGRPVPVQTTPMARWPDGSVKWLEVNFRADVAANSRATYILRTLNPPPKHDERAPTIKYWTNNHQVQIDTGALKWILDKDRFGHYEQIFLPDGDGGWEQVAGGTWGAQIVGEDAKTYLSENYSKGYRIDLIDRGPQHVVIRFWGQHLESLNYDLSKGESHNCDFIFFLHFHAGRPAVQVEYVFVNKEWGRRNLKSVKLIGPRLLGQGPYRVTAPGYSGRIEAEAVIQLNQTGPTAHGYLDQDRSHIDKEALRRGGLDPFAQKPFRYEVKNAASGKTLVSGEKTNGWMLLENAQAGYGVAVQRFWQYHPKSIVASDGRLTVGIWPEWEGSLPFVQGMAKAHRLLLVFCRPQTRAQVPKSLEAFEQPLRAWCSPQWYCDTRAFSPGWITPADPARFAGYERFVSEGFDAYLADQAGVRAYGMIDYGDYTYRYKPKWGNLEYDLAHAAFLQFARTAEAKYFGVGVAAAQHFVDIDICHYAHRGSHDSTGSPRIHADYHVTDSGELGHMWAEGVWDYYFLTADPWAHEVAIRAGDFWTYITDLHHFYGLNERKIGWTLIGLMESYHATNNLKYLKAAQRLVRRTREWWSPVSGVWPKYRKDEHYNPIIDPNAPPDLRAKPFMIGILLEGLLRYHQDTADPVAAEMIVGAANWLATKAWRPKERGYVYDGADDPQRPGMPHDVRTSMGMLYGYLLTGNRTYLEQIKKQLATFLPRARVGANWSTVGKQLANSTRNLPQTIGLLDRLGEWEPIAPAEPTSAPGELPDD